MQSGRSYNMPVSTACGGSMTRRYDPQNGAAGVLFMLAAANVGAGQIGSFVLTHNAVGMSAAMMLIHCRPLPVARNGIGAAAMRQNFAIEQHPVRITVLKKHFHGEFVSKYAANPDVWTECKHFEIGQQFEVSGEMPWAMPEGFCGWAWADIQKLVYGIARGGQPKFVTCCTDGYRPVVFLLEKVMRDA